MATVLKGQNAKINFIKDLGKDGYKLFATYFKLVDVQESVRHLCMLPTSDMPIAVKIKGVDFILFNTKCFGVVVDYMFVQAGDVFELYEITSESYNKYEQYMRGVVQA